MWTKAPSHPDRGAASSGWDDASPWRRIYGRPMGESMATRSMPRAKSGWVWFAAIMLLLAGGLNLLHGFVLLDRKQFVTTHIAYDNLTFWGWVFLVFGALELAAGVTILQRRLGGYKLGVILSGGAMITWFLMAFSAPFEAIVGMIVNGLVLYGLTVGAADDWV
jgi:hypothetical protein